MLFENFWLDCEYDSYCRWIYYIVYMLGNKVISWLLNYKSGFGGKGIIVLVFRNKLVL